MSVAINGVPIPESAIAREVQYHPAANLDEAGYFLPSDDEQ